MSSWVVVRSAGCIRFNRGFAFLICWNILPTGPGAGQAELPRAIFHQGYYFNPSVFAVATYKWVSRSRVSMTQSAWRRHWTDIGNVEAA